MEENEVNTNDCWSRLLYFLRFCCCFYGRRRSTLKRWWCHCWSWCCACFFHRKDLVCCQHGLIEQISSRQNTDCGCCCFAYTRETYVSPQYESGTEKDPLISGPLVVPAYSQNSETAVPAGEVPVLHSSDSDKSEAKTIESDDDESSKEVRIITRDKDTDAPEKDEKGSPISGSTLAPSYHHDGETTGETVKVEAVPAPLSSDSHTINEDKAHPNNTVYCSDCKVDLGHRAEEILGLSTSGSVGAINIFCDRCRNKPRKIGACPRCKGDYIQSAEDVYDVGVCSKLA